MVVGVTDGFSKELEIIGVGYRAEAQSPTTLRLALGYSHPVIMQAPEGVTFEVPTATRVIVRGIDKESSARWPRTSAPSASPSRTRARASATSARRSCARPARPGKK
jgi:large subunit ribosomal protein L6